MKKQANIDAQPFVQSLWNALGEPRMRKWVQDQGMELGPWKPKGNMADYLDEQRFGDIQSNVMRSAASNDPEIVKILKGFNSMLGGTWGPGQQQQAETVRGNLGPIAPILMRWAPEWWDKMHGGTGSVASLASAIADTNRYDPNMTPEKATQMAEEMFQDLYSDPMKNRGFAAIDLGKAYRESAKRGWIGRGMDTEQQLAAFTPVLGAASAVRDVMGSEGYDTSDIQGMFSALDTVAPNAHYDFGQADTDIRTGRYFSQRGGQFGSAMDAAGQGLVPGGASRDELNMQHAQLTEQAGRSETGNMLLATARAADAGMLEEGSSAQEFLDKAMAGELENFEPEDWRKMMEESGVGGATPLHLADQRGENQMFLQRNPKYRGLTEAVRANQTKFDHQRQFDTLDKHYANMPAEVGRGAKSEYLRSRGYKGLTHYNQLHGDAAQQVGSVLADAKGQARVQQNMASMGWKGPVRRGVDELKRGTPSAAGVGGAVLGGIRKPTTPKPIAPTGALAGVPKLPEPIKTAEVRQRTRVEEYEVCEHCGEEIREKSLYCDEDGKWYHRPCKQSGPIKRAAMGIPDRNAYGDPSQFGKDELIDMFIQRHKAQRAGEHFDYRLGTPKTGLLSWSMKPTRLPKPGEKRFVRQQPVHAHGYGAFSGTIGSGYGKGEVRQEQRGKVLITKATPAKIEYTVATSGSPERFVLMRPEKWGEREWLLINVTPKKPVPYEKVRFRKIPAEEVEPFIDQMQAGTSAQAKLDGASSLVQLMKGGAEVLSYRASKRTGRPIVHTERMFGGRPKLDIPAKYKGTVLKGELYGHRSDPDTQLPSAQPGRAAAAGASEEQPQSGSEGDAQADARGVGGGVIAPQELGGLLNATIEHSLGKQREGGIDIRNMIYDIQQMGRKKIDPEVTPYAERRKMIEEVLPFLPKDKFNLAEEATTPEDAKAMWQKIIEGQHPQTREGMVFHPPTGKPIKAKQTEEADVHITDIFPGAGKYRGRGAGGFGYSLAAGGPRVGAVGTGLSDDLRAQLHGNPEQFAGRVARIRAQEQHPSGAYRAPSLIALHEDYPTR